MCLTSMWYECEWLKGKTCKCFSRSYSFCCFLVSTIKIRQILPINCKEINEFLFSTKNKKKQRQFISLNSPHLMACKRRKPKWIERKPNDRFSFRRLPFLSNLLRLLYFVVVVVGVVCREN